MLLIFAMSAVLFGTTGPAFPSSDKGQDIQTKLASRIPDYTLIAEDFGHALLRLASQFNLPMGIEWIRSPGTLKKVNLHWKNANIREMLDTVIRSQPGYQIDTNNNVVHIFPVGVSSSEQDFLNLKLERFEVHNEVVEIASHKLREIVRAKVFPPSPSQRPVGEGYSQGTRMDDPELSFTLRDISIRQVLDKFLLASDRKIWVVTFIGTPVGTKAVPQTATLWNSSHIPDNEQPVWDMFRWNDTIP
jgi:hypothetical protein